MPLKITINLDLDISKLLGKVDPPKQENGTTTSNSKSCPTMNRRRYIDSEKLKDKCHGCDVEKLKKNSEFLKTQF